MQSTSPSVSLPELSPVDTCRAEQEKAGVGVPRNTSLRSSSRRVACRVERLLKHLGLPRPRLYEIVREIDSLLWRIGMTRNNKVYWRGKYLVPRDRSEPTPHRELRMAEFLRNQHIQWLLANHPAASPTDVYIFCLGWNRRHQSNALISEFPQKEVRSTTGSCLPTFDQNPCTL